MTQRDWAPGFPLIGLPIGVFIHNLPSPPVNGARTTVFSTPNIPVNREPDSNSQIVAATNKHKRNNFNNVPVRRSARLVHSDLL